jgi:hypothetical protein
VCLVKIGQNLPASSSSWPSPTSKIGFWEWATHKSELASLLLTPYHCLRVPCELLLQPLASGLNVFFMSMFWEICEECDWDERVFIVFVIHYGDDTCPLRIVQPSLYFGFMCALRTVQPSLYFGFMSRFTQIMNLLITFWICNLLATNLCFLMNSIYASVKFISNCFNQTVSFLITC